MTTFRDSIDPRAIPPSDIVGGYGDGEWIWSPSWYDGSNGWDLHPEAKHLVFVVSAADQGDALDVEMGDATPQQAPGWVRSWNRQTGWRAAMLYCNRATWPDVVGALVAAGIDPASPSVDYLIATLDGTSNVVVPTGAKPPVAIQCRGSAQTGGNFDEWCDIDADWAAGVFPAPPGPTPGPTPTLPQEIAPMSTSLGPTSSDSFAAGYFQGQPANTALAPRSVWVACVADEALPGAQFPTQLVVWFVPRNWPAVPTEQQAITLVASQQVSVTPAQVTGELSVRIQHVSGGAYVARVYEEFLKS
jgi:hypothetical protein